ncbi:MAG: hypothetical protein WKF92_08870 [Pyrinomonadaceae bacterium]
MIAQKGYFRPTIIKEGLEFSFPIFSRGGKDSASTKINRLLQLSELYVLAKPPYSKRIFDQSNANDGSIYGGKVSLLATIYANNSRVLSLGFDQSACGATCGYWNRYYNINSGNGDRIVLKDIFTFDGYQAFSKIILDKRSLKYRKEVKKKVEPQYQESYLDTVGCFERDDFSDFYIRKERIVIDGNDCLVKGQKFDGLNMINAFELSVFRKHLNSYGRTLFGLERADISEFRSKELPQLFEGSVNGSYPIVMVLGRKFYSGYEGFYAYLKYGEGIRIKGSEVGDTIELTEYILSPTVNVGPLGEIRKAMKNGFITGHLSGQSFEGFWTDASKSIQLTFKASVK